MIIATAGHVDHGKTALVKRLTGVDTDTLAEEKRRGLSINLGYAYRRLDDGSCLGFVDVPGHTRFINTMIAGVSGIDIGLLVVAVDDGPMPQTREHLAILHVLGISDYTVVLTKTDKVDAARTAAVRCEVDALLAGHGAEQCPVFAVSNTTGTGIPALSAYLEDRARVLAPRPASGHFRLSIDRAFLLHGAGLLVTGTATAGEICPGDTVTLLPQEKPLRVRSIHVQDANAERGRAGDRCALNIVGDVSKDDIRRGDWLVGEGAGPTSRRVDTMVELLTDAPVALRHLSAVKIYLGAKHCEAKPYLIDRNHGNQLGPGESARVQMIFSEAVSCVHGDRFLIRDSSESLLLGGGLVIDACAPRWGKAHERRLAYLGAMSSMQVADVLRRWLLEQQEWLDRDAFADGWNIREDEMAALLSRLPFAESLVELSTNRQRLLVSEERCQQAGDVLIDLLGNWHRDNTRERGIDREAFRKLCHARLPDPLFSAILDKLLREGGALLRNGQLQLPEHQVSLGGDELHRWLQVRAVLLVHGQQIPLVSELLVELNMDPKLLAKTLIQASRMGALHRVSEKRFGVPEVLLQLATAVNTLSQHDGTVTAAAYKNAIGIGRNFAIELLEYFDEIRFTQRQGNTRVVLDADLPIKYFSDLGER